jgi:hypothetical protein
MFPKSESPINKIKNSIYPRPSSSCMSCHIPNILIDPNKKEPLQPRTCQSAARKIKPISERIENPKL